MTNSQSLFTPIPPPGVGIHPPSIATQSESLTMKSSFSGNHFLITDQTGKEIFNVDAEHFSMSHRMQVTDSASGQRLCTLRKENWKMRTQYYAELSEDGPRIFKIESKMSFSSEKYAISFSNALGNREDITLDWKTPAFSSKGEIYWNGILVALLQKEHFKLRGEFTIHVAPGMDKLLAVCVMACVDDSRSGKGGGSGGGGAAGGGGGC